MTNDYTRAVRSLMSPDDAKPKMATSEQLTDLRLLSRDSSLSPLSRAAIAAALATIDALIHEQDNIDQYVTTLVAARDEARTRLAKVTKAAQRVYINHGPKMRTGLKDDEWADLAAAIADLPNVGSESP